MVSSDPGPAIDARPPPRVPVGFLAGLAACCLLAVIALAVAIHGGPAPTAAGLALAILPVPLVMAGVLYLDRLEPEPPMLLAITFGAGAAMAALIGFVGHALGSTLITTPELGPKAGQVATTTLGAAFVGALIAETLKGAVLVGLLRYQRAEINGVSDGVVYGATTGLGWALVANLFAYVQAERSGLAALVSAFFQRALLTPLWDPLFTSMIGIGVAYAAMQPWRRGRWAVLGGWVAAVALHTLWDDSLHAGAGRTAVVYVILLLAFGGLLAAMVRDRSRMVGLIRELLAPFKDPVVMTDRRSADADRPADEAARAAVGPAALRAARRRHHGQVSAHRDGAGAGVRPGPARADGPGRVHRAARELAGGDEPGRVRPARPAAAVSVLGPGRHLRHGIAPEDPAGRAARPPAVQRRRWPHRGRRRLAS